MTSHPATPWPPYQFKNQQLAVAALCHSSVATKRKAGLEHFERLEFLGDRVVGLVVAEILLGVFPMESEGDLARRHTALVRAETMADIATEIGLDRHLDTAGTLAGVNVLADALEAFLGAVYLDGGLDAAAALIKTWWHKSRVTTQGVAKRDPKSALQEWAQARALPLPVYSLLSQTGPAHAPLFQIQVSVGENQSASAQGPSRKQAEAAAATSLLLLLESSSS